MCSKHTVMQIHVDYPIHKMFKCQTPCSLNQLDELMVLRDELQNLSTSQLQGQSRAIDASVGRPIYA